MKINPSNLAPWGASEKQQWFQEQSIQRSYHEEVLSQIELLKSRFELVPYGQLSIHPSRYPLYLLKSRSFRPDRKTILITGGVHGYETSGVHGALAFLDQKADQYSEDFNFVCAPCISPWAYETINRWNPMAIDPNRSFYPNSPAEECRFFLEAMAPLQETIFAHFDLHETTDTDNTIFRLALQARDAKPQELSPIPDGFYVVGLTTLPQLEFQKAVIESVKKITHIAPPDEKGMIIGVPIASEGVIFYDMKKLSLCGGFSNAKYSTTTEVYPDSPRVTPEICNQAQIAAIEGGLQFIRS